MDEMRTWQGSAHAAATEMFKRAVERASDYRDYTTAVAAALRTGSATIGKARTDLLHESDAIDPTELGVGDNWVVQIRPAAMTADMPPNCRNRLKRREGDQRATDRGRQRRRRDDSVARTGESVQRG